MSRRTRSLGLGFASVSAIIVVATLVVSSFIPASIGAAQRPSAAPALTLGGLMGILGSGNSMGSAPTFIGQAAPAFAGATTHHRRASACGTPHGPLMTRADWIVEAKDPNCKVRLVGATWYGMQTTTYALAGLDFLPYKQILTEIKRFGFNTIRIPLSDELVKDSASIKIAWNRWLKKQNPKDIRHGIHPLQLLDKIVAAAAKLHIMIILDNHFSAARNFADMANNTAVHKSASCDTGEATWSSDCYTQQQWIKDWTTLTQRYKNDPNVIGFDLRNEPHTAYQHHQWNLKDYLTAGATWGKCNVALCGAKANLWKPSSDWVTAAEAAGDAIQKVNPRVLLFVEGTQLYPDPANKRYHVEAYWWGSILKGVAVDPVRFTVPDHLVYSPHEWGPWKCCGLDNEFGWSSTYKSVTKVFYDNWAYILTDKNKSIQAPIWLGEFNTCNSAQMHHGPKYVPKGVYPIKTAGACVGTAKSKPGTEGQWFQILIKYLRRNPEISWSYYPLNGTNVLNQASDNSILNSKWTGYRLGALRQALAYIENQPGN